MAVLEFKEGSGPDEARHPHGRRHADGYNS
jgi:hypothetical protein